MSTPAYQRFWLRRARAGFSLIEVVAATMILGVVMVAALNSLGAYIRGQQRLGDRSRGWLLAQELLSEIMQQEYEEGEDTVAFGRESGESGSLRQDYDDVDDYNNWSASPPQDKDGNADGDLTGWTRSAVVELVDPNAPQSVVGSDQGAKRIVVTVMRDGQQVAQLTGIRTLAGPQPPFE